MNTTLGRAVWKSCGHRIRCRLIGDLRKKLFGFCSWEEPVLIGKIRLARERFEQAEARVDGCMVQALIAAEVGLCPHSWSTCRSCPEWG